MTLGDQNVNLSRVSQAARLVSQPKDTAGSHGRRTRMAAGKRGPRSRPLIRQRRRECCRYSKTRRNRNSGKNCELCGRHHRRHERIQSPAPRLIRRSRETMRQSRMRYPFAAYRPGSGTRLCGKGLQSMLLKAGRTNIPLDEWSSFAPIVLPASLNPRRLSIAARLIAW